MTAATIKITEGVPAAYPEMPAWEFPFETTIIWRGHIWRRLEDWTGYRLGERTVTFIAEGPGDWRPPLSPTTITTLEKWTGTVWEAVTLDPTPLGGFALASDTYRFIGTVGENGQDKVPEPFALAFIRLAEYFRAIDVNIDPELEQVTNDSYGFSQESDGDYSYQRMPGWRARAMQISGAADLLRGFRDLGAR